MIEIIVQFSLHKKYTQIHLQKKEEKKKVYSYAIKLPCSRTQLHKLSDLLMNVNWFPKWRVY